VRRSPENPSLAGLGDQGIDLSVAELRGLSEVIAGASLFIQGNFEMPRIVLSPGSFESS
jgi:hypothetical protein